MTGRSGIAATRPPEVEPEPPGAGLRVDRRVPRALGLTVLLLGLLVSLSELAARAEFLAPRLPAPAWVRSSSDVNNKFNRVEALVKSEGPVDCFFLGGSAVAGGMDPQLFAEAYRGRTGREIRCFNFGLGGAADSAVALVATTLAHRYHPGLFILGEGIHRGEGRGLALELEETLADEPWLRWYEGAFSVEGWLIERSAAYRRVLGIRRLLRSRGATAEGEHVRQPEELYSLAESFELHMVALDRILRALGPDRVIVLALPVSPRFLTTARANSPLFERQMTAVMELAKGAGALVWRLETIDLSPVEAWYDSGHVNDAGARVFNRWLGEQVGDAVTQGVIPDPAARAARLRSSG